MASDEIFCLICSVEDLICCPVQFEPLEKQSFEVFPFCATYGKGLGITDDQMHKPKQGMGKIVCKFSPSGFLVTKSTPRVSDLATYIHRTGS